MEIGKSRALQVEWLYPKVLRELYVPHYDFREIMDWANQLETAIETHVSRPPDWPWFSGLDGSVAVPAAGEFLRILATGQPYSSGQIILDPSITRARINFQGNWYDLGYNSSNNGPNPWGENR